MLLDIFWVLLGIAMLYYGGEFLVDNAIRLARSFGVSEMAIGLTVVAFATSAPELAATLTAAYKDSPDIAIGNVLGSNLANLGLILGSAAFVVPLTVTARFVRREVSFMVVVTILAYPLMQTGYLINRLEGLVFFLLLLTFIVLSLRDPDHQQTTENEQDEEGQPVWRAVLGVAIGVALLVGGAQALVEGASNIARSFHVPERVIGLTLVALGTSLPELAASIVAARRQEGDLVLGNVIGSNIFNLLCILGLTSMVKPITVAPAALAFDFWVTLGISVLVLGLLALRRKLVRSEGLLLLAIYFGYMVWLFVSLPN